MDVMWNDWHFLLESMLVQMEPMTASVLNHSVILLKFQTSLENLWSHVFQILNLYDDKPKWKALWLFLLNFNQWWFGSIILSCWNPTIGSLLTNTLAILPKKQAALLYMLPSRSLHFATSPPPRWPLVSIWRYFHSYLLNSWLHEDQALFLFTAESWHLAQGLAWCRSSICFE